MATDAITGFLEGITSGFERGTTLRRQRTFDQQQAEELQRQRIAEQIEAGRQAVLDQQNADRAAREAAEFQLETGLAPQAAPPPTGAVPGAVSQLRGDVGRALDPGSVVRPGEAERVSETQVPAGFQRVGPSTGERESERVQALRADVGRFLGATPEERTEMLRDPAVIGALQELGQLGDVFERRTAGRDFGVTAGGITGRAETPKAAIALREELAPTVTGVDPKVVSDLRQEFSRDKTVMDSALIFQSFNRLESVASAPESGPNDLAIIFSFMKMVDPGSTVREGEFATAENAQGVDERVRALWNRALEGTRLTPATRLDFIQSAKLLMEGQRVALDRVLERFTGLAERSGIPVEDVVFNPFGEVGPETSPAVDAEEDAFLDDLVAQGLSDEEIDARLREFRRGR